VCESTSAGKNPVHIESVLALPEASTSFTDFSNYVKVTSHRKPSNKSKGKQKDEKKQENITIVRDSIVALRKTNELSKESLARNGVPRILPIVEINDDLKTLADTTDEAIRILKSNSGLEQVKSYEIIPIFHLEPFDKVHLPLGIGTVNLHEASIPLGVGGNMTIGAHKWVSKPVKIRRIRHKRTVNKKKHKGGKAEHHHGH
jgi:hypothetical protein